MLDQIKEEAATRKATVEYLKEFPADVSSIEEKYWVQIQYLLDYIDILSVARGHEDDTIM
jgi:hypothetical protein